jgi:hypothetical protein
MYVTNRPFTQTLGMAVTAAQPTEGRGLEAARRFADMEREYGKQRLQGDSQTWSESTVNRGCKEIQRHGARVW